MKNFKTRALPAKLVEQIDAYYPDTIMGIWCKQHHKISFQENANAKNTKNLITNQTTRRVGKV